MTILSQTASKSIVRPSILILVAVTAVNPLALNLYIPSMPSVQSEFSASASMVQLTLSLGLLGTAFIQLLIGPLSDQFGRRPILLGGLVIAVLASFYCALAPSLDHLIFARIVQVAGGAAGLVLGRAIVRDTHSTNEAASMLGYVTMGMAMAPMIGPVIGGILDDLWSWRAGFHFTGLFSLAVLIAAWINLSETNQYIGQAKSPKDLLRDYRQLLGMRPFWVYTAVSAFAAGTFFSFLGAAPYVSRALFDMSPTEYGLYFILVAGGYSLGNFFSGRYSALVGLYRMMLVGNLLTLAACSVLVILSLMSIESPQILFAAMFFLGIGNGVTLPNSNAGVVSVMPRLAGSSSGLSGSLVTMTAASASFLVTLVLSDSLLPMGLFMAGCALLALLFGLVSPAVTEEE
ncbi:multidrug effflux MFS transporter [Cohaesibacter gelatinilyticus]|uniref:Bcr/CflA family efflux transporter n=1 Tax=Cohaesibacter gelatinilyticus TaxID=372072 RepID=A0A285NCS0_9HYPH|nr:multidrug effflux MFS transporter [Cohaesibacter gelatinilyticus]SNZ07265.1 MFS transporter, DHA1 family, bicyclomycin/chloramphenicol resistance protein [Cohaesibacter gelatinilyticus]